MLGSMRGNLVVRTLPLRFFSVRAAEVRGSFICRMISMLTAGHVHV